MSDNNPTGILDTPAGKVHFCMTAADHVYLHSESSPADNPVEAVTFHRIRYHVNFHCYLVDGVWTAKDWHEPYLRRKDTHGEASNAARKTARESLGRAWTEYLAAHPELSRQAALSNAKDCLDRRAGASRRSSGAIGCQEGRVPRPATPTTPLKCQRF